MDFSKLPTNFFAAALQFTKTIHDDVYPSIDPARKELSLPGKVVIITGASRGLGAKAFAPAFAKAGVKGLVLLATNAEGLRSTEQKIRELNPAVQVLTITADVSDGSAVMSAFAKIKDAFGHADILINNSGINADGEGVRFADADPEKWWRQFEINAKGTFLMSRSFINQLPSIEETTATIINLTTGAAWKGSPFLAGYGMSKLVVQQQIPAIAATYPSITAVALHPGLQETDMLPQAMRRFDRDSPELAGGVAVWLCHPHARFLSGRVVASEWDVDDLVARKEEIEASADLTIDLMGKFGSQHFA
ncbi:NAD(P)-binding protein [Xylariaceae sp. FL0594]|nr:NAD(P)-binding protein [Xylariaceae sp. FL0594]